jgi:plastocyanin
MLAIRNSTRSAVAASRLFVSVDALEVLGASASVLMRELVATWMHAVGLAMQLALLLTVIGGAVVAAGCSGSEPRRAPERERERDDSPRDRPPAYEPIEVVNGGTITGRVTWSGASPELVELPVATHREACGETQVSPALAIGRRSGIAGTVIWLEGIARGRAIEVPEAPVVIEVAGCAFRPHVVAAIVGARIAIRNVEQVLHNVHASRWRGPRQEQTWFSRALPELGASYEEALAAPGIVRLVDDAAHPWMLGWVHAFEHPYFAVSDAEGRFQLSRIPPGQYTLRAWHEGVRVTGETEAGRPVYSAPIVLGRPVTVTAGHDTPVDFAITGEIADAAGN